MIKINNFRGRRPRYSNRLIPDNNATLAENCDLLSGEIRTWNGLSFESQLEVAGEVQTIYRYGDYWLQWANDVDVVKLAASGDDIGLIAFSGDGAPRILDETMVDVDGDEVYPESSLSLGLYAPSVAPSVADSGPGADPKDRAYVYTFVRKWPGGKIDEGPPSPASAVVIATSGDSVTLSGIEAVSDTDYGITHVFIYRAATAGGTTEFQFVAEIAVNTTTYFDSIDDDLLGETLTSTYYDPPPDDLQGLTVMQNGVLVGFRQKEVCFSAPYQPHAWPVTYRKPVDSLIVALGVVGANVVVATQGPPYLISGVDPAAMTDVNLGGDHPCTSKRALVETKDGVIYPTADGLLVVSVGAVQLATTQLITRREWKHYYPQHMHAYYHDGRFFGFFREGTEQGGLIIDFNENDLTDLPYYPSAGYVDEERDELYLAFPYGAGILVSGDCCEGDSIYANANGVSGGGAGDNDPPVGASISMRFYIADQGNEYASAEVLCVVTVAGSWSGGDWEGHVVYTNLVDPLNLKNPLDSYPNNAVTFSEAIITHNGMSWTFDDPAWNTAPPDVNCQPIGVGDNQVYAWNAGGDRLLYTWRSKTFHRPELAYAAARVIANRTGSVDPGEIAIASANNQALIDAGLYGCGDLNGHDMNTYEVNGDCLYPVPSGADVDTLYFKLFGDGNLIHTEAVYDDHAFRLPATKRYHEVAVEVSGNRDVQEIRVGMSVEEIT